MKRSICKNIFNEDLCLVGLIIQSKKLAYKPL